MDAYQQGNYDAARRYLYEAILQEQDLPPTVRPAYIDSAVRLSDAEVKAERFTAAREILDEARGILRDDPKLRQARVRMLLAEANAKLRKDDLEAARSSIIEVLRIEPSNASALRLRGQINVRLAEIDLNNGRWNNALTRYQEYLKDFPDDNAVRRQAADAHIRRGNELYAAHHAREALAAYGGALAYVPEDEKAIAAGLRTAREAGGGLADNYRYLIAQAPRDKALRGAVVEQLKGRAHDALDSGEIFQARDYLVAAYGLDLRRNAELASYQEIVEGIVSYQYQRGDSPQAIRTLKEMGAVIEPLAETFQQRAMAMEESDKAFFLALKDDIALLNKVHSDVQLTLAQGTGTLSPAQINQAQLLANFLKRQRDTLTEVSRQRDRRVLEREAFRVRHEDVEVLFNIIEKSQYERYKKLLDNYRDMTR